jgi:hypothetical protein
MQPRLEDADRRYLGQPAPIPHCQRETAYEMRTKLHYCIVAMTHPLVVRTSQWT